MKPTGKMVYLLAYAPDIALVTEGEYEEFYDVPVEALDPLPQDAVRGTDWEPWYIPKGAPRLNVQGGNHHVEVRQ